jgi:hypothetical protein
MLVFGVLFLLLSAFIQLFHPDPRDAGFQGAFISLGLIG